MKEEIKSHWHTWVFWITLATVIIFIYKAIDSIGFLTTAFKHLFSILSPFLVGLLIAYLLYIPESKIEKVYKKAKPKILNKHARKWGILTTYIITILIIVIIINFILPVLGESINELISNVQLYYTKIIDTYKNLKNEDKYESNSELNVIYSEGGEVSSPYNNLKAKLNIQKDDEQNYYYADGQVLFADEEYLESEIIKENEIYGVRFSDVVKQFVGIKNDENLENVAKDIGIDSIYLESIIDIIDGTREASDEVISQKDRTEIKDQYSKIITDAVIQGNFSKQKNAVITYNNASTKTYAYTVTLTSQQVEDMIVKILNNAKQDTSILDKFSGYFDEDNFKNQIDDLIDKITNELEIPSAKITVYENNKKTIRTVIEFGVNKVIVENSEKDGENISDLKFSITLNDTMYEFETKISKKDTDNDEKIEIDVQNLDENNNYNISFLTNMQKSEDNITLSSTVTYKKDILNIKVSVDNDVNIGKSFEKKQALLERNHIVLNDMQAERRKKIIDELKEKVPEKAEVRTELLLEALGIKIKEENKEQENPDYVMPQVEINKFNSKFEFYTGDEVTSSNVKVLLSIVKDHLINAEVTEINPENATGTVRPEDVKYIFKLNIEKDKANETEENKVVEKIKDNKKYKVSITYKESNGLIDYITIEEL